MFRFPKAALDPQTIEPYCRDDFLTLELEGNYYLLDFSLDEEEFDDEWLETSDNLSKLIPIREQILRGDYRALYLGWLKAISIEEPDEDNPEEEPPIPAGLGNLDSSHRTFIEFFALDEHLVKAAAKTSPEIQPEPTASLEKALLQLTHDECLTFLSRVLNNEPQVGMALQKRLRQLSGLKPVSVGQDRREAGDIFKEAGHLQQEYLRRQKAEAEQKRIQKLLDLAKHEEATWHWVESLIGQKQAGPYAEAAQLLVSLRDLAIYQNRLLKFQERFITMQDRYRNRPALMERFKRAGL
jgi:hypothetical protein